MSDLVGQQWGKYRLTRLLGQGGFAQVYLGQHLRLNNGGLCQPFLAFSQTHWQRIVMLGRFCVVHFTILLY